MGHSIGFGILSPAMRWAALPLLACAGLCGEDLAEQARRLLPADLEGPRRAVLENIAGRARDSFARIPRASGAKQADAARDGLRARLTEALGHRRLPWPPNLQARVAGIVRREGYRIEKLVFQSLPGDFIAAHLYMPDRIQGRAPAVLFYNGHWFADSKTRPDFQSFCINMARLGFVVLNFDPFGQGERGISSRDHRRTEGLLSGVAQQGFAEYDTQSALHYLLSRPEVDPQRIGMTGASGGGLNTWMTAALDARISVAVPVVATTDLYRQMMAHQPRDWNPFDHCHYIPGLFRFANYHEILAMAAPRPLLFINATEDGGVPVAGTREVAEYGKMLYRSYGAEDRIAYYEDSVMGHGYQQSKREAAYGWFLRWLMGTGDGRPYAEPPTQTAAWDDPELRCFPVGANRAAGPAMVEAARLLARRPLPLFDRANLARVLGDWPAPPPAARFRIGRERVERAVMSSEPGIDVPVLLLKPAAAARGLVIAVHDGGKEELAADVVIRRLLDAGWAVAGIDPRGIGELRTDKPNWCFASTLLIGQNFVWLQSWDLVHVMQVLGQASPFNGKPAGIYAHGHNASLAATYLIGQRPDLSGLALRWFVLRDGFVSYRQFLDRPESMRASFELSDTEAANRKYLDREIPPAYFPFGALRFFDLPQLLKASPAQGMVVTPISGEWKPLKPAEAKAMLPRGVRVITGDGADEQAWALLKSWL